jgi:hypothetical protein
MLYSKRGIKKKFLDWLWKAISVNNTQMIFIGDNTAMATDGIRMHIFNKDQLPEKINGLHTSNWISAITSDEKTASFFINPKYLVDALQGFISTKPKDDVVKLEVIRASAKHKHITISDDRDTLHAIIMCVERSKQNE